MTVRVRLRMYLMQSLIHSVCCCRQVVMLHRAAEGASGTAVVNRLGYPCTWSPMVVRMSFPHSSLSDRPPRPRISMRVSAPVPASKPVARMMMSSSWSVPSAVLMPVRRHAFDRVVPDADGLDVGAVVDLEIVGLQRDAVRAEPVVSWDQQLAQLGVLNRARIFSRTNSETSSLTASSKNISAKEASQSFSEPFS